MYKTIKLYTLERLIIFNYLIVLSNFCFKSFLVYVYVIQLLMLLFNMFMKFSAINNNYCYNNIQLFFFLYSLAILSICQYIFLFPILNDDKSTKTL